MTNIPRPMIPPAASHPVAQPNGVSMAEANFQSLSHKMDLKHLYDMISELSEVLKDNHEMTRNIVSNAETIMKRPVPTENANTPPQGNGVNNSNTTTTDPDREPTWERKAKTLLQAREADNRLILEYENIIGIMVEQIRTYCQENNMNYFTTERRYRDLLQRERDTHLDLRLERDELHAKNTRYAQMIRTALNLRAQEDAAYIRVVAGLQNEVRGYRNALGLEPEAPEEEYGWEILKDVSGKSPSDD
ncbi:hypothetical protein BDV25DRAFT_141317 [Aspergillus avenaceus]|uniref:Uncharacterized protein n=1 Tax=Aspergillus avenaceus TaxID=36643 RepID=A0A5N6TRL7_ASPAV|nr:hypothetical protein BDV25DRAFT_141317 [Aspergillus avenaceus]